MNFALAIPPQAARGHGDRVGRNQGPSYNSQAAAEVELRRIRLKEAEVLSSGTLYFIWRNVLLKWFWKVNPPTKSSTSLC